MTQSITPSFSFLLKATVIQINPLINKSDFLITISCDIKRWEVTRTYEEFLSLDKDLKLNEGSFVHVLAFNSETAEDFETYINLLLEQFSADQLKSLFFQRFIDNADQTSEITKIRLNLFKKHVNSLHEQSLLHERVVQQMDAKYAHLSDVLTNIMDRSHRKTALLTEQSLQTDTYDYSLEYDQQPASNSKSSVWSQPNSSGSSSGRKPSSIFLKPEPDSLSDMQSPLYRLGSSASFFGDLDLSVTRVEVDDDDFDSADRADNYLDDSTPRGSFMDLSAYSSVQANNMSFPDLKATAPVAHSRSNNNSRPVSTKRSPETFRSSPQFDDFFTKWEDPDKSCAETRQQKDSGELLYLPNSKHLSTELYPPVTLGAVSVNKIIALVQPNEARVAHHASAVSMLKKETRVALNFHAFDTGLRRLNCFLPDDPVRLGVVCRRRKAMMEGGSEASWQSDLMDHLKLVAMIGSSDILHSHSSDVIAYLNSLYSDEADRAVLASAAEHSLSDVKTMPESRHEVNCSVDSMLHVTINAQTRADLCMLAFLEEFSGLVGQDHLFKRSLLLIRAWWVYETAAYVGCPVKNYISDFSLSIMVCAIFNQYHAQIGSPLQALCLFLTEYSGYDGSTHAITLQGVARFRSANNSQLCVPSVRPAHLVDAALMDRYENLFSLSSTSASTQQNVLSPMREAAAESIHQGLKTSSSEDTAVDDYASGVLLNAASSDSINLMGDDTSDEDRQSVKFVRRVTGIHVLHPFERTNMESESGIKPKQSGLLVKAFQTGAANLSLVLRSLAELQQRGAEDWDSALADDVIRNFFPVLFNRFGGPIAVKRNDKIRLSPSSALTERDLWEVSTEPLWCNILYCNLVQEAVLSESALIMLTAEILAEQGPLLVGDVGKLLAQETKVVQLPQKLKERFGGLKEFLCHYPDHFVCAHDHVQNPHILLRKTLSTEDQLLLDQSEHFPPQLLAKLLKTRGEAGTSLLVSSGDSHGPTMAKKVTNSVDHFQPHLVRSSSPAVPELPVHGNLLSRLHATSPAQPAMVMSLGASRSPESSASHSPVASIGKMAPAVDISGAAKPPVMATAAAVPLPKKKLNNPKRQPFQPHLQYLLQEGNKPVQIAPVVVRPTPPQMVSPPQYQQQQQQRPFFHGQQQQLVGEDFSLYEELPQMQSYQNQQFRGPPVAQPQHRVTPPPYAIQSSPRHTHQQQQALMPLSHGSSSRGGGGGGGFSPMYSSGASGRSSSLSGDALDDSDDYYYLQQQQQQQAQQRHVQQQQRPVFAEDRRLSDALPSLGGLLGRPMHGNNRRIGVGAESPFGGDDDLHFQQQQQRVHHLQQQQQQHHQHSLQSHSREMDAALGVYFPQQTPMSSAARGGREHFH